MDDKNLKELLRIGQDYLRRLKAGRFHDDAFSHWMLRLANHKEWPHDDALDYWRMYGRNAMLWSLRTVIAKYKRDEAAEANYERPINAEETEGPLEDSRLPRYHELLATCTKKQQGVLERMRAGEELKGTDYTNCWKGLRKIRKALGTDEEYSKKDRRRRG